MNKAALFLADGTRFDGNGLRLRGSRARRGGVLHRYDRLRRSADRSVIRRTNSDVHVSDDRQLRHLAAMSRNIRAHASRARSSNASRAILRTTPRASICRRGWTSSAVPTLIDADTRSITITLREHGTIWAALAVGEEALARAEARLTEFVRGATHQRTRAECCNAQPSTSKAIRTARASCCWIAA